MLIGYARVSTDDQNLNLQKDALQQAGCVKIYYPYQEFTYPTALFAKRAISDYLAQPLARLSTEQRAFIDALLAETLNKKAVMKRVRQYFQSASGGEQDAY